MLLHKAHMLGEIHVSSTEFPFDNDPKPLYIYNYDNLHYICMNLFDAPNSILEDQKFGIFLGILPDPLYATLCT